MAMFIALVLQGWPPGTLHVLGHLWWCVSIHSNDAPFCSVLSHSVQDGDWEQSQSGFPFPGVWRRRHAAVCVGECQVLPYPQSLEQVYWVCCGENHTKPVSSLLLCRPASWLTVIEIDAISGTEHDRNSLLRQEGESRGGSSVSWALSFLCHKWYYYNKEETSIMFLPDFTSAGINPHLTFSCLFISFHRSRDNCCSPFQLWKYKHMHSVSPPQTIALLELQSVTCICGASRVVY